MFTFYLNMQKRRDKKVYADLHKTDERIYFTVKDAQAAIDADPELKPYRHVVEMVAMTMQDYEEQSKEIADLRAELEALKRQEPVAYKHRDGMLSKRLPGGPVLGIDWTPLYAAPVPKAPSVPDGWQLVPKVPTPEMRRAAAKHYESAEYSGTASTYRAMLAAAPQPERVTSNSIGVEAVCVVVDGLDGKRLDWLIEGGLGDLPEGATLIFAHQAITDADGWGEVFLAAPQPESSE